MNRAFNQEEVARLKRLIDEGIQVNHELDALKEGLKETVKAIAEEIDLKPAILNKAIKVAYKASLGDEREKFDELETILDAVGRNI